MTQKSANPFEMFDFSRFTEAFNTGGFDLQAVAERQRSAVQAVMDVNRTALEGYQSVMMRQGEILKDTMENLSDGLREVMSQSEPTEAAAKQVEVTRDVFAQAYENLRELTEMASEANNDAFRVFQDHLTTQFEDVRKAANDVAEAPKPAASTTRKSTRKAAS